MDRFIPDPASRRTPPSPGRPIRLLQRVALGAIGVCVLIGVGAVALSLSTQSVPGTDGASRAATTDDLVTASIAPVSTAAGQTPPVTITEPLRDSKSDRLHVQWQQKHAALRQRIETSVPVAVRQEAARTAPRASPASQAQRFATAAAPVQQSRRPAATEPDREPTHIAVEAPATAHQDDAAAPGEAISRALGEPAEVAEPEQEPEPEPAAVSHRTAPVLDDVNMRSGPDNGAAVITVVPNGNRVEVIDCDYWCEVRYSGKRGWIYKRFIRGAS